MALDKTLHSLGKSLALSLLDSNQKEEESISPIHLAASRGQIQLIQQYLSDKVHDRDDLGNSALHYALAGEHFDLAYRLIVDYKFSPWETNKLGIGYKDGFKKWPLSDDQAFKLCRVLLDESVYQAAKKDLEKAKDDLPMIPNDCQDKDLTDQTILKSVIANVVKKIINHSETHFIEYLSYLAAYQDHQNAPSIKSVI